MTEETVKQLYPTLDIQVMLNQLQAVKNEDEGKIFDEKYRVDTLFENRIPLVIFFNLFQSHLPFLKGTDREAYRKKLDEIEECAKHMEIPVENAVIYYQIMQERYMKGQYVFIAHTKGRKEYQAFDLNECAENARYITTEECNKCKKKEDLKMCEGCHRAAYCSRECQKQDWRVFHQFYCKHLNLDK